MMRSSRGFTLVDVVVGIGLLLVVFLALFGVLRASLMLSTLAKAKSAATELANTQMEYLHGLSYDAVGTIGGIPAGTVPQVATSTVDGITYVTRTYIVYKDDPADGVGVSDTNGITTDYKTGKVEVSYTMNGFAKDVSLISNFVPQGVEATTNGGTLSLHIVDAAGANVSGATVQIVDTETSPAINFTTFSDANGMVTVGGAATSSQYQVYASRSGYSSAQTYARTTQNVSPTPGYLTVVKNQTTSATFAIDRLASLTLASFSPADTKTFSDYFSSAANLSSQTNTQVTGNAVTLASQPYPAGYALSGTARSIPIGTSYLDGWGMLSATTLTPAGTAISLHVTDASGVWLPDSALPGNSVGFSTFPVSLTGLATSSYPSLSLEADLTSNSTTTTPSLQNWSLSHTEGPAPLPNIAFTLTGAKTIGADSTGTPIYKTVVNDTTGATGARTESLEWDAYSLALASSNLIESCIASPYGLTPASATTTALIVGTPSANALSVSVADTTGNLLGGAKVVLTAGDYAATILTSACGLAYFNNLAATTYTAIVSATGHATTTTTVPVSGNTGAVTITLP